MEIYLQNTLSGEKDIFTPISPGKVGIYNCGPTVYDYAHIGNLRSYVFADILRRMFEWNGYEVNQVMNITDIGHLSSDADDGEDKMTKALKREGKPLTLKAMRKVADFYFEKFKDDLIALNIELPSHFPFASDHIAEDIEIITKLSEKGFTYTISDGVYFDTSKFPQYGKLGHIVMTDSDHSRVGVNPEKKNSRDFALWKFSARGGSASGGNVDLGYESPFGKGFPGWHIECSAMSRKYLGQPFDIHTGGIDHIPVHHNNEIAQSEAAYDVPLAHVWMHNAFLNIKSEHGEELKMAKSVGNFITIQTLRDENINPIALRYLFLMARYSSPLQFNWEILKSCETARKRMKKIIQSTDTSGKTDTARLEYYTNTFTQHINDDLDTPQALALIFNLVKDDAISEFDKRKLILDFDRVLGLKLDEPEVVPEIPEEVQKLVNQRNIARANKDFALSDDLRSQIESLGFSVKDTDEGIEIDRM